MGIVSEQKHNGNLGEDYTVEFVYNDLLRYGEVRIRDNGAEYVGIGVKQALSLLAWLQQEQETLERLAKE